MFCIYIRLTGEEWVTKKGQNTSDYLYVQYAS